MDKWDKRFLDMANLVASWSKDPSTKCGAVITTTDHRIVSVGFNGFPKGTNDDPALYANRPEKYRRVVHAEKNAILFAQGQNLRGCILYVVPLPPCSQCAGMIIQAGIARVVTYEPSQELWERWGEEINTTWKMFRDVGINYVQINQDKKI